VTTVYAHAVNDARHRQEVRERIFPPVRGSPCRQPPTEARERGPRERPSLVQRKDDSWAESPDSWAGANSVTRPENRKAREPAWFLGSTRSGRWGSNPRPSAWEADALPTELRPRGQQCSHFPGHRPPAEGPKRGLSQSLLKKRRTTPKGPPRSLWSKDGLPSTSLRVPPPLLPKPPELLPVKVGELLWVDERQERERSRSTRRAGAGGRWCGTRSRFSGP
jgi:hypothetical protein